MNERPSVHPSCFCEDNTRIIVWPFYSERLVVDLSLAFFSPTYLFFHIVIVVGCQNNSFTIHMHNNNERPGNPQKPQPLNVQDKNGHTIKSRVISPNHISNYVWRYVSFKFMKWIRTSVHPSCYCEDDTRMHSLLSTSKLCEVPYQALEVTYHWAGIVWSSISLSTV